MITGIDHLVIAVRDLSRGVRAYENLLARAAAPAMAHDGAESALIATDNAAVEIMAPLGEGETARRLRASLDAEGEGLKSLVFATSDLVRMHNRAERVGLAPGEIVDRGAWRSFRVDAECTHGVRLFFIERNQALAPAPRGEACATGLDHIVIRSPQAERALALYGARLGLDLRLDRGVAGARLLFFRCADMIIEVAVRADAARDQLWGLSWRAADADAAHGRLAALGFDVSEVRYGHKPGTRVFTVRDGTCGVPTLMTEQSRRRD